MAWLDAAKGFGIILVVYAHAIRGLMVAGIAPDAGALHMIDKGIYAFHMPLFFVLAGMTFQGTALRLPLKDFVVSRALRLLWPLALWTWIFFFFRILLGSYTNAVQRWDSFPWSPFPPQLHFWFLWALFLISLAGYALLRTMGPRLGFLRLALLGGAVSTALSLWIPDLGIAASWYVPTLLHAPFFFAGLVIAQTGLPRQGLRLTVLALVGLAVIMALAHHPASPLVTLSTALVCSLAVIMLMRALPDGLTLRALVFFGQASLAIFLSHTVFSAGLRGVLIKLGVMDPFVHGVSGVLFGLLAPLLLWAAARRFGLMRLAGF